MTKCAEYYLDSHRVEIHYSLLGNECILVNGNKISEKPTLAKKPHNFKLGNDSYDIISKLDLTGPSGRNYVVLKNGQALSLVNFKTQNSKVLLMLAIALGIGVALTVGMAFFQLS